MPFTLPNEIQSAVPQMAQVGKSGDDAIVNPIVAPQILIKHCGESRRFCLNMRNWIIDGDAIKTIYSVKELNTSDLELAEFAIAAAEDTGFAEGIEPEKAVFFRVGAGIAGREYTIEIKVGMNKGDILVGKCRFNVVD